VESRQWHERRPGGREALTSCKKKLNYRISSTLPAGFFSPVEQRRGRLKELKERVRQASAHSQRPGNCRPTQVGDETFLRNSRLGEFSRPTTTHRPVLVLASTLPSAGAMPQILSQPVQALRTAYTAR
jgi:hypothetical protein